jgi:DNA-binding response OmpR family regulator
MTDKPIILVEDNDKLRRMYAETLEAVGFTVMRASGGQKAVELMHKVVNPQLIILDVMMPRMDGIETCTRIRKMQGAAQCPLVFLTSLDRPETLLECLRAGGDDYLMKSSPIPEFIERVQYWARKGSFDDIAHRRQLAIKELEEVIAESEGGASAEAAPGFDTQARLEQLTAFLAENEDALRDEDDEGFYRFGYLVGLVTASAPLMANSQSSFKRFLRNLILKSGFLSGKEAEALLDEIGVTVNKNGIPFDQHPPNTSSGIRLGTPATTSRGFGPVEMRSVGRFIIEAIATRGDAAAHDRLAAEVADITSRFPVPGLAERD